MTSVLRFVLLGAVAALLAASPVRAGDLRIALVIGNAAYENADPLPNPVHDASDVAAALDAMGFEVHLGLDLARGDLASRLEAFAERLEVASTAVVYYAGHGLQVNGRNFILPVDARLADEADLPFELVPLDEVVQLLYAHRLTTVVFLDACRNNPLGEALAEALGERRDAVGAGLAAIDVGYGSLLAYATQPGNVAFDGEGRNSPFTGALLRHIATPDTDVQAMLRLVRRDVIAATAEQQIPWDNSSLVGTLELARSTSGDGDRQAPGPVREDGPPAVVEKPAQGDLSLFLPPGGGATGTRTDGPSTSGRPPVDACDIVAGSDNDRERVVPGNEFRVLDGTAGIAVCEKALAAYPGTPRFMYQLARSYQKAERYGEAARLYEPLVRQGYLAAFTNYGYMMERGLGVARDHERAVRLHLSASHQGDKFAMFNTAAAYDSGDGLPANPVQAARWIYAALRLGHDYTVRQMRGAWKGWTLEFRIELQRLMREAGLYEGQLDGIFGPRFMAGLDRLPSLPNAPLPGGTRPGAN